MSLSIDGQDGQISNARAFTNNTIGTIHSVAARALVDEEARILDDMPNTSTVHDEGK